MGLLADLTPSGPQPGDRLGHYQLLTEVGSGGMGRVWAARQEGALQRLVAIKTALCDSSQTKEFERVFMDEARIASLIHHPHVCGVYELGEATDVLYLVMEWSDGGTLLELVDESPDGKLAAPVAAYIATKVCAGLHASHELEDELGDPLNVVHRDVTPQNILFAANGHIRLADFGVAKAQGQLHKATETGEIKGKLSYMAPEQLTGKDVDRRVDVFALGCVLYESSLGTRPFHGDGALSTLYQILEQDVKTPRTLDPDYPEELERIVLRALAKEPADRYQSAEDMRQDLEVWLAGCDEVVADADISQLVNERLRDSIDERQKNIENAILRLDHPEQFQQKQDTEDTFAQVTPAPAATIEASSAPSETTRWLVPGLVGGVAIGAAAVFAIASTANVADVQPPTVAAVSTPGVAGLSGPDSVELMHAKAETVRVVVLAQPAEAAIQVDGQVPRRGLYSGEFQKSDEPRTVTVSAPKHQTVTRQVVFKDNIELVIKLERELQEQQRGLRAERSVAKSQRQEKDLNAGKVKLGHSKLSETSYGSSKTEQNLVPGRRSLDQENPFGD